MSDSERFAVGQVLAARSAGNSECVWRYEVTRRTPAMVTLRDVDSGEVVRVKIYDHGDGEFALPHGRHSMSPSLRPSRPA